MSEASRYKIPPHDLVAEQSLLGAVLISKTAAALVLGRIKADYFYKDAHAAILKAILGLYERNEPIDLVTLSAELLKMGLLESSGGRTYLSEVMQSVPTAANAEKYADIVEEKYLLRRLIDVGSNMVTTAFEPTILANEAVEQAQKQVLDLSKEMVRDDFVEIKSVLNTVFDSIQQTYGNEDRILGVPSGFKDLDGMTSGFQRGDLVILAARPSMGKTTLALNLAAHAAIHKQQAVAIFSCEMPKEQLAMRMLCSEAKLDSKRLRTANLKEHEYRDLNQAFGRLADTPIFIDDSAGVTPLEMRAKTRRLQMEHDVRLIIIDYLQLMRGSKSRNESRFQEISDIVRDVKGFAKESGIPIIALSQLSRDIEKRQDKRPQLSDLRESGEIEQTADLVMFIHRDSYYEGNGGGDTSAAKLIIAKQRNGPTGEVNLVFRRDISLFLSAAPAHIVPQ
ncbi:replicative DNA helicase [bacterium]|nr:replicative DNA helicase [bacterium]